MSNQKSVVIVPEGSQARHVRGKNSGKDWYVQRCGLVDKDGLQSPFEVWHRKQDETLKPGLYNVESDGAYINDERLVMRPKFVPAAAPAQK